MKESITDWDSIAHKNVRASDGEPVRNIVAVSGNVIQVETAGSRGQS